MGLENFKTEDLEQGEEYHELRIIGEAIIEYPGLYKKLPRDVRGMLPPTVDYTEEFIEVKLPFQFTVRGNTEKQAWNSSREKLDMIREADFNDDLAEVTDVNIRRENAKVKEKDW